MPGEEQREREREDIFEILILSIQSSSMYKKELFRVSICSNKRKKRVQIYFE